MIIKFCRFHITVFILAVVCVSFIVGIFTDSIAVISTVGQERELLCLVYGEISEESDLNNENVSKTLFINDLNYLKEKGYETVFPSQVDGFIMGYNDISPESVMICFDNINKSIYEVAYPALKEAGMKASIFVPTSLADDSKDSGEYLDWSEISELSESGVFSIESGSHDMNSMNYKRKAMQRNNGESTEDYEIAIFNDISMSYQLIYNYTGVYPSAVIYPFGIGSAETFTALANCGVKLVIGMEERVNIINNADPGHRSEIGSFKRKAGVSTAIFFERVGI